jgi:hypothetical protein
MISKIIFGFIDNSAGATNFMLKYYNGLVSDTGDTILDELYLKLNSNLLNKVSALSSDFD